MTSLKLQQENLRANNKLTNSSSPLFKQLMAIKLAKERGICYKCDADIEVDGNSVCANCEARDE